MCCMGFCRGCEAVQILLIQRGLRRLRAGLVSRSFASPKYTLVSMVRRVNGEGFLGMIIVCIAVACCSLTNFLGLFIFTLSVPRAEF